jgi:hypothetical protein
MPAADNNLPIQILECNGRVEIDEEQKLVRIYEEFVPGGYIIHGVRPHRHNTYKLGENSLGVCYIEIIIHFNFPSSAHRDNCYNIIDYCLNL